MQQTPGAIPALGICRKSGHGETRPPAPIIHQPPCWARSASPRQQLGITAAAADGGRRRLAATPACHPVGDRGGCGGATGRWRRISAGPRPLHLPMVRHQQKEAGRKLAGRLGGASSRDAVTSPRRRSEARAVAWRRVGAAGTRRTMAAACGGGCAPGPARSGHCQGSVCPRPVLPVPRVTSERLQAGPKARRPAAGLSERNSPRAHGLWVVIASLAYPY